VKVLSEVGKRHHAPEGLAVAHDVEVRLLEIDDAAPVLGDIRVGDVPLVRNGPIKDLGAARHLIEIERYPTSHSSQRFSDPVARDAATDREELAHKRLHRLA
jgi:hypothetical protein